MKAPTLPLRPLSQKKTDLPISRPVVDRGREHGSQESIFMGKFYEYEYSPVLYTKLPTLIP